MRNIWLASALVACVLHLPAWAKSVEAPLEFVDGTPAVTLSMGGQPTRFIIDTGASLQLYLPPASAAQVAGLREQGTRQRTFDLSGTVQEVRKFSVERFALGDLDFGKVDGVFLKPAGLSVIGPKKFNDRIPVLGLAMFRNKALLLDFAGQRFAMADTLGELLPNGTGNWRRLSAEATRQGLMVPFHSARKPYRMVLDSAANMSVVNAAKVPKEEETGECPFQLNGERQCRYIEVAIDGVESITPVMLSLPKAFGGDGVAGKEFFQKVRLVYDGNGGNVYVQDAGGKHDAP